jgi:hypothetical protein
VQRLIAALRNWRTHRTGGPLRRSDARMAPDDVDLLLNKLISTASLDGDATVSFDNGAMGPRIVGMDR